MYYTKCSWKYFNIDDTVTLRRISTSVRPSLRTQCPFTPAWFSIFFLCASQTSQMYVSNCMGKDIKRFLGRDAIFLADPKWYTLKVYSYKKTSKMSTGLTLIFVLQEIYTKYLILYYKMKHMNRWLMHNIIYFYSNPTDTFYNEIVKNYCLLIKKICSFS